MRNTFDQKEFKKAFEIGSFYQYGDESLNLCKTHQYKQLEPNELSTKQYNLQASLQDIDFELSKRINQLQVLKEFIIKETKIFISKIEQKCCKKLKEIDSQIIKFKNYLVNKDLLQQKEASQDLFSLSFKKLEIIFHRLKKTVVFYDNSFFVEKFNVPKEISQAKNFVFSLFSDFKENVSSISSLAVSNDSRFTVIGRNDEKVKVFDNQTFSIIQQYIGLKATVMSVAISNDCQLVMAGLFNQSVFIWNLSSNTLVKVFKSRSLRIDKVCFTNDFKYLACVGEHGKNVIFEFRRLKDYEEVHKNGIPEDWLMRYPEVHTW